MEAHGGGHGDQCASRAHCRLAGLGACPDPRSSPLGCGGGCHSGDFALTVPYFWEVGGTTSDYAYCTSPTIASGGCPTSFQGGGESLTFARGDDGFTTWTGTLGRRLWLVLGIICTTRGDDAKRKSIQMDTQGKVVKSMNSKIAISKFSSSNIKSVGVTKRSMSKNLKESSQLSPLTEYVEKNLPSPSYATKGTIRNKIEGSSKSSLTYSKPYSLRIDNLKMPIGTYGDHLVKQFVLSLKGNAFDKYTDLKVGSIDGWE
ncbi:hypothetical protein Sango_1063600 [Sesamum angolense]|uniref:Uncharacterized protein n=1 Tax=Sesamum angolense TaxID=2727404 RepID=A0AAE1X238_9LAMI|nr:hypothetical protein Sango_1063600 [Sesamum angolense]